MLNRVAKNKASSDNWKSKYSHVIEELAAKEREWVKAEELLRRTIRRLTIAANGIHPVLDQRLSELRKNMEQHLDLDLLQRVTDSMPDTLRELAKETQHQLTPAKVLLTLIDQLEQVDSIRQQANTLRSRLQNEPDQDELQSIVKQISSLLDKPAGANQCNEEATQNTNSIEQINLINTFISNLDFPEISNTKLMSIQARSAEAGPEIRRELAVELTTLLNKAGAQLEEKIQPINNKTYEAAEAISMLIEFLNFPEILMTEVSAIRVRLEKPLSEEEWPRLLKLLANIIERARDQIQQQKHELENFLSELTNRIESMDMSVSGLSEIRAQARECSESIQKNVSESVEGIQDSITSHNDIEQLRESVFGQLDGLRLHVRGYQNQQDKNNSHSEQLIGELSKKLESMEHETSALREQVKQHRDQSIIDPLTKTFNRLAFDERMILEFARWKRDKKPLSLVVWDADHFKLVNDTFGHLAGDNVLRLIADTLRNNSRESDFIARYGGEEFVTILPGADGQAALVIAESIRKMVEFSNYSFEGKPVPITISAGIAEFEDNDKPETVFARADGALYEAKRNGRNRCQLAAPGSSK